MIKEPKDHNRTLLYIMSQQSRRPDSGQPEEMPTVVNSDSRQESRHDSQVSLISRVKTSSGQEAVLNDIGNHWSPHSPLGIPPEEKPTNFWRRTIATVMMPFMLTGAPIPSAILTTSFELETPVNSTINWFRSMTSGKILPFVGVTLIITLFLNGWLFFLLSDIFIKLFIVGEVPFYFMETLYEIFEVIPIVLAVDLFWVKGYLLKEIIYKMDRISTNSIQTNQLETYLKLIVVYVICISIHVINYFTFQWRLKFGYTSESNSEYFKHLPHRLVNTFLIPVYITFCSVRPVLNQFIAKILIVFYIEKDIRRKMNFYFENFN